MKDFRLVIKNKSALMSIRVWSKAISKHRSQNMKGERKQMTPFSMTNVSLSKKVTLQVNLKKTVKISMSMTPAQVTVTPQSENLFHLKRHLEEQLIAKMEK